MKIDYAIHSSDSNPFYLDFWPLVSRVWKEKFSVTPVLVYIDENHDIPIDTTYGFVIKMKPVKNIPVYVQCLWVRYWYPSQFQDKVSIICDIDMFPISRNYFLKQIEHVPNDAYVHLNPNSNPLPSCYHIATGSLFKKVLCLDDAWEDSIRRVWKYDGGESHSPYGVDFGKWGVDEKYATDLVHSYKDKSVFVFIPRTHKRVDRSRWEYTENDIANDVHADSHSIRPYAKHRAEIDSLVDIIMKYR